MRMEEFEMKKLIMAFVVMSVLLVGTVGFCRAIMVDAYMYTASDTGHSYYIKSVEPIYQGARLYLIDVLIESRDRNDKIVHNGIAVDFAHRADGSWYCRNIKVKEGTLADKILRYSLEVLGERY